MGNLDTQTYPRTHTHTSLVKYIATPFFSTEISKYDQSISDQELLLIIDYQLSMTIFKVYSV